jgi:exodeoxyribonuclease VII large subunit
LFQRIDALETGIKSTIKNLIIVNKNRTKILSSNLLQFSPTSLLQQSNHRLESIGKRLSGETSKIINEKKSLLLGQVSTLEAVSPLAVLGRGYSIISKNDGSVITSDKDVSVGEEIVGKLKDGLIKAKVIKN